MGELTKRHYVAKALCTQSVSQSPTSVHEVAIYAHRKAALFKIAFFRIDTRSKMIINHQKKRYSHK